MDAGQTIRLSGITRLAGPCGHILHVVADHAGHTESTTGAGGALGCTSNAGPCAGVEVVARHA